MTLKITFKITWYILRMLKFTKDYKIYRLYFFLNKLQIYSVKQYDSIFCLVENG